MTTVKVTAGQRKTAQELADELRNREQKAEAMVDGTSDTSPISAERILGDYRVSFLSPPLHGFDGTALEFREPAYPVNSKVQKELGGLSAVLWAAGLPKFWKDDALDLQGLADSINNAVPGDDANETPESLQSYLEGLWASPTLDDWMTALLNALCLVCVRPEAMTEEDLRQCLSEQLPVSRVVPTIKCLFELMGGHTGGMADRFFRPAEKAIPDPR